MSDYLSRQGDGGPYYWYGWVWDEDPEGRSPGYGLKEGGGPYFINYYGEPFSSLEAAQIESQRRAQEFNETYGVTPVDGPPRLMVATWGISFRAPDATPVESETLFSGSFSRELGDWEWSL